MTLFENLALGFSHAATPSALLYCFMGTLLGTLIGVLPGLGPITTIALLLPLTFTLTPTVAIIMLAGIYYGAQYGGSTTAILLNLPGESSSVMTAVDGHQMARQGRAGEALAIAALGSFFAGTVATLLIAMFSPPLSALAQNFGSPEYFSIMVLGLVAAVSLSSGSALKALATGVMGLALGLVGMDIYVGVPRLTFGFPELMDGVDFVAVSMGMFGLAEIVRNLDAGAASGAQTFPVGRKMLSKAALRASVGPVGRGTMLGSLLGILPGGGAVLSSFVSYTIERRLARDKSRFGHGAIEGVAGPESANNAGAQMSFIPMLTLGIPSNPVMALMIGALVIQGIVPGPQIITSQPDLFWGLIASMWIGNVFLVILNLPLVGLWVKVLKTPYRLLYPIIITLCCVGVYSVDLSSFDVVVLAIFAVVGYLFIRLGCEPAPLLLGFVLGPMLEDHLRRSLLLSDGSFMIFLEHPLSATLLAIAAIFLAFSLMPSIRRRRDEVFQE